MTEEALGQHYLRFWEKSHLSIVCPVVQSQKRRCAMDLADSPTPHLETLPRTGTGQVRRKISESGCDGGAVQGHA